MYEFEDSYKSLTEKIDAFIDKFYRIEALKGFFLSGLLLIFVFIVAIILEKNLRLSSFWRGVLFYGSTIIVLASFINQFILPLMRSFRLIARMQHKDAAIYINDKVPEVTDQLINVIELSQKESETSKSLLLASISKKSLNLLGIDILSRISLKQYKTYIISFISLFLATFFCSIAFPSFILDPLKRVIQYENNFSVKSSYSYTVNNGNALIVLENEDLNLSIKSQGENVPEKLILYSKNNRYFPITVAENKYEYTFKNNQENFSFFILNEIGDSLKFPVTVFPKAKLITERKIAEYPRYTKLNNDTFINISKVALPYGTKLYWDVQTKNTNDLKISFEDTLYNLSTNQTSFFYQPKYSQNYTIEFSNKLSSHTDSLKYFIELKNDRYPTISLNEFCDSSLKEYKYFIGDIEDDYGFSKLSFVYYTNYDSSKNEFPVSFQNHNKSSFGFEFNFSTVPLSEGEKLFYFFSVWDNDGFGVKESRSKINVISFPGNKERKKERKEKIVAQKNALNKLQRKLNLYQENLSEIKSSILNNKDINWNDKNNLQNFIKNQKSIQIELEKIKNNLLREIPFQSNPLDKELLKKQEQLQNMVDNLMSDEMKKLYDELNELVKEMNKDKLLDKIDDIEFSQKDMIKDLDRTIEHFKRLEVEMKAAEIAEKLESLSKKQDSLQNKTNSQELSQLQKIKKQENIKSDFYDIKLNLLELKQKNNDLSTPKKIETEQEENSIKESLENSESELSQNKNKKAGKSQKESSSKMNSLAKKLNMLSKSSSSQQMEDMESLRLLLEQLITFSLDQEDLMLSLKNTSVQDPKYVNIGKEQRKLKDKIKIIDDSLTNLAKRQIMVSKKINTEIQFINRLLASSIKNITERKTNTARANQQKVMRHTNELGLLLSEILEQMQNSMPGSGQCNKPGGKGKKSGKPNLETAEQLKKQIGNMKKFLEQQKNGKKPGNKGNNYEMLGRMAAEQAIIRKQIMEEAQKMNNDGSKKGNKLKEIIKDIEDIENQIINNEIDLSSVKRQEEIKIKLLEFENANKEQEQDNKRESNEAEEIYKRNNLEIYEEYLKIKNKELELLKSIPPNLKPYYKNKVNEYFKKLEN